MKPAKFVVLSALFWLSSAGLVSASEPLMASSGCLSCHRVDTKLIGPAFKEVAARYRGKPESIDTLLQKVREGGEGEWGDVPMAPNTIEKVSEDNLRLIIKWILSL